MAPLDFHPVEGRMRLVLLAERGRLAKPNRRESVAKDGTRGNTYPGEMVWFGMLSPEAGGALVNKSTTSPRPFE